MKNGWKEGKGSTHGVSGEEDGMALFPSSPHLHWGLKTIIGLYLITVIHGYQQPCLLVCVFPFL